MAKVLLTHLLVYLVLAVDAAVFAGEMLYNGIELPDQWPPNYGEPTGEPQPVPYQSSPPDVIPIDVGRQLFVDDFLIEYTTLQRTFHRGTMYPANPVIHAAPYSGGVWYDMRDEMFKIWYNAGGSLGYATSQDGIHWEKPALDVVDGSSAVLRHVVRWDPQGTPMNCDSTSVWIDYEEDDPSKRYKYFVTYLWPNNVNDFFLSLRYSADGTHWGEPVATSWRLVGDHTTAHYNPFRKKWIANIRYHHGSDNRCRAYLENRDPEELTWRAKEAREVLPVSDRPSEERIVPWLAADRLDPHNPRPVATKIRPQLYHFDALAYESLMLGFFTVHQGPPNKECDRLGIPKRNEVVVGYSRDGFHFDRPNRRPLLPAVEEEDAWNWGNVQSSGGACLVVGDQLYLYYNGVGLGENRGRKTGLVFLRRDGFASMGSIRDEGILTTRPVRFGGKYLFINADCDQGELCVEVLDKDGKVVRPFTKDNCVPVMVDKTLARVEWKGAEDLSGLAGEPVQFRFSLRLGELYSFWVSPDKSGASYGYVGAGGPGYTSFVDTVGEGAIR